MYNVLSIDMENLLSLFSYMKDGLSNEATATPKI
jgi:hypothetical protein